jgi:DNA-binding transcriptional MerR regulator
VEEVSIGEFARRSRLSIKALRLYDELGVLVPARVDEASGYRYYDVAQLEAAHLVSMLRQLDLPLAAIKELLACDPVDAAEQIAAHWRKVESAHDARRELANCRRRVGVHFERRRPAAQAIEGGTSTPATTPRCE